MTSWEQNFDSTSTGSLPSGWTQSTNSTSGSWDVRKGESTSSFNALRGNEPDGGSGSDIWANTSNYSPTGNHTISFDAYFDSVNLKEQYAKFDFFNRDSAGENDSGQQYTYRLSFEGGNNDILIENGNGKTKLQDFSQNQWYNVEIDVRYDTSDYYVRIDGTEYGPFDFDSALSASEANYFTVKDGNSTVYIDTIVAGEVDLGRPSDASASASGTKRVGVVRCRRSGRPVMD